jgi:hypothetical protein
MIGGEKESMKRGLDAGDMKGRELFGIAKEFPYSGG